MTHHEHPAFSATPPSGNGPGVLVLHAWWGLNDTIKAFCTRLAGEGFVVSAPDLYHGKVATTIAEAEALGKALDEKYQQAGQEIAAQAATLREKVHRPLARSATGAEAGLAVIGFSLGAFYALDLAADHPELISSVVLFYGTGTLDHSKSRAAYLGHFAGNDVYEPPENVDGLEQALRAVGRPVAFHRYPGTEHWFFEPDRPQYNAEAAGLAWQRTLEFLLPPLTTG